MTEYVYRYLKMYKRQQITSLYNLTSNNNLQLQPWIQLIWKEYRKWKNNWHGFYIVLKAFYKIGQNNTHHCSILVESIPIIKFILELPIFQCSCILNEK